MRSTGGAGLRDGAFLSFERVGIRVGFQLIFCTNVRFENLLCTMRSFSLNSKLSTLNPSWPSDTFISPNAMSEKTVEKIRFWEVANPSAWSFSTCFLPVCFSEPGNLTGPVNWPWNHGFLSLYPPPPVCHVLTQKTSFSPVSLFLTCASITLLLPRFPLSLPLWKESRNQEPNVNLHFYRFSIWFIGSSYFSMNENLFSLSLLVENHFEFLEKKWRNSWYCRWWEVQVHETWSSSSPSFEPIPTCIARDSIASSFERVTQIVSFIPPRFFPPSHFLINVPRFLSRSQKRGFLSQPQEEKQKHNHQSILYIIKRRNYRCSNQIRSGTNHPFLSLFALFFISSQPGFKNITLSGTRSGIKTRMK